MSNRPDRGETVAESALGPYRVLDLSDEKGMFCGKILAGLGADVIKVERPGGDPSRNIGPFYHNIADPQKSLFWFFHNTEKRGITLDIASADGRAIFEKLVATSDIIFETFPPGYMSSLGLGYEHLKKVKPGIIFVSITPFGQTGPYKDYRLDDIVAMAMGGYMQFLGDPDRAPLRVTVPQSYLHAGCHAANSALMALYYLQSGGPGQSIDVSVHESVVRALWYEIATWELEHRITRREGAHIHRAKIDTPELWDCKGGRVAFRIILGTYARTVRAVAELMKEEGMPLGILEGIKDWESISYDDFDQPTMDAWVEAIGSYFKVHTKEELFNKALERKISLGPCYTVKELVEFKQFAARGFWKEIEHDDLVEKIVYPGPPANLDLTPWRMGRRAPRIGEHNIEVYTSLGMSREQLATLKQAGVI